MDDYGSAKPTRLATPNSRARQLSNLCHFREWLFEIQRVTNGVNWAMIRLLHYEQSLGFIITSSDNVQKGPVAVRKIRLLITLTASVTFASSNTSADHQKKSTSENRAIEIPTIKECDVCPVMKILPGGEFLMDAKEDEYELIRTRPQVAITIEPFAISVFEVTYEEWMSCVDDGGCDNHRPETFGLENVSSLPVMDVSIEHARSYVRWLNRKVLGQPYRLPTESEWEYAARGGTTSPFWWGDEPSFEHARSSEKPETREPYGRFSPNLAPSPIGSFSANPFGLFDMEGNVYEWVEGCAVDLIDMPRDGTAARNDEFCRPVVRSSTPISGEVGKASFARHFWNIHIPRANHLGFRVAKKVGLSE